QEAAAYVLTDITVDELDWAIKMHSWGAKCWLLILFLSAFIAFRIAWWVSIPDDKILWGAGAIFPQLPDHPTSIDVAAHLGRKLFLLAAAFAVPLLALRVYYTHLHNLVINRQRKISIRAFTKFYALMKDADAATKVELVKQAAQTIFAQGATGFLAKGRIEFPFSQLTTS